MLAQVPGGWSAGTQFSSLFSPQARGLGRAIIPDFAFAVDDLHRATDQDLRRRALPDQATLTLWLMRDIRDRTTMLTHVRNWADVLERLARGVDGDQALALLLRYVALASGDLQLTEFRDVLHGHAPTVEALAMTIAEQLEAKAISAGRAEGRARGRAEGEAKGRSEATANSILMVLEARGVRVSEVVRGRIQDCGNLDQLDQWLVLAATATSADDIFQAE